MPTVSFVISELPPGPNSRGSKDKRVKGTSGMHWAERGELFERWRWLLAEQCGLHGFPEFGAGPVIVRVTRCSANLMDWDNFAASLKPVLDALVRNRVLEDDNPRIVLRLELAQQPAPTKQQALLIDIETV